MHQDKAADRLDHPADILTGGVVGRDRSANRDSAVFRDLGSDIADATNVNVAVLLGEAEFGGEMFAHQVTVEKRDWSSTHFEKFRQQDIGNARFARPRED